MTKFQALYVKYCRVRLDCTWRMVEAMYHARYEQKVSFDLANQAMTNQQNGRILCGLAQEILGEI